MGYSHYPKTVGNIVMAWVQPPPPDVPPGDEMPDFVGRPFSEINLWKEPLAPGKSVVSYHDAQPFTKFYGSVACDQPLEVNLTFSNDEVDAAGHWITDENIDQLHYDALGHIPQPGIPAGVAFENRTQIASRGKVGFLGGGPHEFP